MEDSILNTIKNMIGINDSDDSFDVAVIANINSAFFILHQLGVGTEKTFSISDATSVWSDFLPDSEEKFEAVKTYVYLKTKIVFDPPTNSFVLTSMQNQISEYEWRFKEEAESI